MPRGVELFRGKPGQLRGYYRIVRDKRGRFMKGTHKKVIQKYEIFAHTNERTTEGTSVRHELNAEIDSNLSPDQLETDLRGKVKDAFIKDAGKDRSIFGRWKFRGYDKHGAPNYVFQKDKFYFSVERTGVAEKMSKSLKYSVDIMDIRKSQRGKAPYKTIQGRLF